MQQGPQARIVQDKHDQPSTVCGQASTEICDYEQTVVKMRILGCRWFKEEGCQLLDPTASPLCHRGKVENVVTRMAVTMG